MIQFPTGIQIVKLYLVEHGFGTDLFYTHTDGRCDLHAGYKFERLASHSSWSVDLERGWLTVTEVSCVCENDTRT